MCENKNILIFWHTIFAVCIFIHEMYYASAGLTLDGFLYILFLSLKSSLSKMAYLVEFSNVAFEVCHWVTLSNKVFYVQLTFKSVKNVALDIFN